MNDDEEAVLVEQRAKIDVRTTLLRFSIGLNAGLLAGLVVHFLANCS